ncbi:hypothetical protein [Marinactinospora rubrisoli]|uniref:DoxX family protein n=1 Tax=Marinactinospora rubrisoli TaxID=2715399 RepID=A0ABW2KB18_9ACTN
MPALPTLLTFGDRLHARARRVPALHRFTWGVRALLAVGFALPGWVKLRGEMFGNLPDHGPTAEFLHAFDRVGHLAEFVGVCQITAAILLLVPRTALLGALIYLPVIAGITVITLTTEFSRSFTGLITTLMLLGCGYLICWDWHRIKSVLDPGLDDPPVPDEHHPTQEGR